MAGAEQRWVDNLLTRFELPGVESAGQGTTRRISNLGIYHVALVARLVRGIGIPIEPASALAVRLMAADDGQPVTLLGGELQLHFDRAAFVASVDSVIADAVELTVPPRRGRPPTPR